MATAQNNYFLALARSAESIAQCQRGVRTYPYNSTEVMAGILQALLMTLGGAQPSSTTMPPEVGVVGLSDPVQVESLKPNLTWAQFNPSFPFGSVQVGNTGTIAADGSAASVIAYASSFAFPTSTDYVFLSIKNNYQSNPWQLTVQGTLYTTTGFTINVAGAPTSDTVSADYWAIGH